MEIQSIVMEEREGKYGFDIFPMLQQGEELILSKDRAGKAVVCRAGAERELQIDKGMLEELPYAYVSVRSGETYGTPVRLLTKPPRIRRLLLQPEGRVKFLQTGQDQYSRQAGIELTFYHRKENRGAVSLGSGAFEFDLAQVGIAFDERIAVEMQARFRLTDENRTIVFGPVLHMMVVINPPKIEQIVREEREILLKLSKRPISPLYAKLYRGGQEIGGVLPCVSREEQESDCAGSGAVYKIPADTFHLDGDFYALSIACVNEQTASYWSAPLLVITRRPLIRSAHFDGQGWTVQMREVGYYGWQGNYGWTDQIRTEDGRAPEIRYADRCGEAVSLGPAARLAEKSGECFLLRDGVCCLQGAAKSLPLAAEYARCANASFAISEQEGGWSLVIREGYRGTVGQDFRELLMAECTSYQQIEELSECFGGMALKPEDMLSVRYGYRPAQGACDIRAGMLLCLTYEHYQNIPEAERWADSESGRAQEPEEAVSNRNLSGFAGGGSGTFCSILRDGAVTFEPFAQETVRDGRMVVEPPQLAGDGRISMGAGIWDTLFAQFQAPFVKLLYPAQWRGGWHGSHGSMYYYENVCLAAADSYARLEEAARRFQTQSAPAEDVAYVCFRGRTEARLLIHVFVEGHPQCCPLGMTLGDIAAAYGLGRRVLLERLYREKYIPFPDADPRLPLYIGDRICSR